MLKQTVIAMRDLPRMKEIISILMRYGLDEFLYRLKLIQPFPSLKRHKPDQHRLQNPYLSLPQRFRIAFEELGPTFIKFGQILSTRVDIFNPEWIDEFQRLQNNVRPIAQSDITALIAAYLERPVNEVFKHIEPTPIGSASIAQVHKAILLDGSVVAVKIKRPNIEKTIQADLRIMKHLAYLLENEIPESRRYHPIEMVHYFARSLARETDLSMELRNMERFSRAYEAHPYVHIPQVYPEFSNRKILVQEYIGDTLLKNINLSQYNQEWLSQRAKDIAQLILDMILKHGYFHADPHPGNIFLSDEGCITLIDFGLAGFLGGNRRTEIITLINAIIDRDQFTIQHVLSDWAQGDLPDENRLGNDVMEMLMNYEFTSLKDISLSYIVNDITSIIRENNLTLPGDLVMLFRTLITLEGVVNQLDGDFQLMESTRPLVEDLVLTHFSFDQAKKKVKTHSYTFLQLLDDLPHTLIRMNKRLKSGQIKVNLDMARLDDFGHQLDRSTNRLTVAIVTASLIIGSSIALHVDVGPNIFGMPLLGFFGYTIAFLNSIWILWSLWRAGKH
ncbi:ABC1 kinase family protein [Vitreoscilla stercoraria]|uniref:AarF/UbiB family protein n=1 Tax=Vitreoscilla stercoraria TaxID=61 RepID=A0ABY4EBW2_VITST|nr:AarF/UbiB family protein [Vitreoscilla stercoraria]UOO92894.1 AarF/UbiB family protein [Vitreoscilla stercoraria]